MMPPIEKATCQICKVTEDNVRIVSHNCDKCDNSIYCHNNCLKSKKCNKCEMFLIF